MAFKRSAVRLPLAPPIFSSPGSSNIAASESAARFSTISVRQIKPRELDPRGAQRPAHRALDLAVGGRATNGRDLPARISAYDARALIPTERAAFSYQPKDLKSVCRGVRRRFLFDPFLGREAIDLLSTFRDAFRFKLVSLWRKALFLVAPLRHQINGAPSRQVMLLHTGGRRNFGAFLRGTDRHT